MYQRKKRNKLTAKGKELNYVCLVAIYMFLSGVYLSDAMPSWAAHYGNSLRKYVGIYGAHYPL